MTDTLTEQSFASAIVDRRRSEPVVVPHIVGGTERLDGPVINREDPSQPNVVVSTCHDAPETLVHEAVAASRAAQREWARVPLAERARRVRAGAKYVEDNRDELAVRLALEIGKNAETAYGEIDEFLEFVRRYPEYVKDEDTFLDPRDEGAAGVTNQSVLRPYGVFGVITPFNYPMALSGGPAIAAVLAGNGVVIKTSHHAPWSCQAVYETFKTMDLPVGLVNIVHGADEPGKVLAAGDIDGISFVGSYEVGAEILRQVAAGPYPRPVIAEMGGKNPVIVTDSANLEAAADGIVFSGFHMTGQKCSALSRVLVTPGVHDRLVALVEERIVGLKMADPADPEAFSGPLVTPGAVARYEELVSSAKEAGFRISGGGRPSEENYLVNPVAISGVPEDHALATTEHFLPLITISKVESLDDGIRAANETHLGLTAGVYTGDREEAETFLERIEAGCVNVNAPGHAVTGWFPGPQTFGGWKGSGSTGKHAYGRWYVLQFARQQARKVDASFEDLLKV